MVQLVAVVVLYSTCQEVSEPPAVQVAVASVELILEIAKLIGATQGGAEVVKVTTVVYGLSTLVPHNDLTRT